MSKVKKDTTCSEDYSSSSYSSSSLSSDEEIDARDLKPIKEYLSDRRELARQLLKSVKPEKVRMMLPQVLKQVDLNELEEWCASELSGMSRARILAILNGKPMLESSETSESDNSGPSLEIISDTEEWLSDTEVSKKPEGKLSQTLGKTKIKNEKTKCKRKLHSDKRNNADKSEVKPKANYKEESSNKQKDIEVKEEGEKETTKEKDGDSLLDLLELEMRARAIRALIRKEEDIIPNTIASNTNTRNTALKEQLAQEDLKEKEICRRQLEKIITSKQVSIGDDEDVVLVVQPTPTIELSSESDGEEHGTRINQRLENERVAEMEVEKTSEIQSQLENESIKNSNRSEKNKIQTDESRKQINDDSEKNKDKELKNNHNSGNVNINRKSHSSPVNHKDPHVYKKRKLNRKVQADVQTSENSEEISTSNKSNQKTLDVSEEEVNTAVDERISENEENQSEKECKRKEENFEERRVSRKSSASEEDKLNDYEEIIDLDDYSDDMEDMESSDNKNKDNEKQIKWKKFEGSSTVNKTDTKKTVSAETWATRYYQTDDVQNVIKESKIQSEIRKRLRERQRLSKLNKLSSSNNNPTPTQSEATEDKRESKPTGSVEEYLALKNATSTNIVTDRNDINAIQDADTNKSDNTLSKHEETDNLVDNKETGMNLLKEDNGNENESTLSSLIDTQAKITEQSHDDRHPV